MLEYHTALTARSRMPSSQLLMTALVKINDADNKPIVARAILDTGASAHFMSENFAKRLRLPMQTCSIPIGMMNSTNSKSNNLINVTISSLHSNFRKTLTFLTIPSIADCVPTEFFPRESISIPPNCRLADPQFHIPRPVDLLIGSGATLSMFSIGQIRIRSDSDFFIQKTQLGWIVVGGFDTNQNTKSLTCNFAELTNAITKFWHIEEIALPKPRTHEEIECEKHYIKNVTRTQDGRYIVRLPFRNQTVFGDSRMMAIRRFQALERKLKLNENLKTEYSRVMQEYIDLGHMSLSDNESSDGYYLPHHAVIKMSSSTTKVRVVFDASAKSRSGKSLNDMLMIGATIQNKIFEHLVRFRSHRYVITADIEKMYRQVLVHKDDRKYQRILWRVNDEIRTFELNTVTFGVSSAPFLAIRTIIQLANDEEKKYPIAAHVIKRDLYVDDLLTGAETIEKAETLRDQIIQLLKLGGFNIRQWASNHKNVLNGLSEDSINSKLILDKESNLKTLGVSWDSIHDNISYSVKSIHIGDKVTKRMILSEIAKIYDPLGLLGPVILYAKRIMQETWKCKSEWDESVPMDLFSLWTSFAQQLDLLNNLTINRYLFINDHEDFQIHGFCDASERGYGACLYIRSRDKSGKIKCQLLCAKSRVASLKPLTILRLELNGALLLARLYQETCQALQSSSARVSFWSDSTIVLHWLKTEPKLLKTYASHRVAEIQNKTKVSHWRHVRSKDNPADALSRGQKPSEFLQNKIWFEGPDWLRNSEDTWPTGIGQLDNDLPELKKIIALQANIINDDVTCRFSSYSKLVRVIAYCR